MNQSEGSPTVVTIRALAELAACKTNGRGRADQASMEELTDSVRSHGILQPLIVRPREDGAFEVVCGHRRLEAARSAGLKLIPVIERPLTDHEAAEIQLIENLQREDLSPLDEAQAIERLLTLVTIDEAQARLGKSRAYLASRTMLTRLPQEARLALEAGTLSLSVALMVARIPDETLREQVAGEVQGGRQVYDPDADEPTHTPLTIAEARKAFERTMLKLEHATFDTQDPMLLDLAGSCAGCPKRTGNNVDLFGDVDDRDVCTDPACFRDKRDLGWAVRKAEAIAKGYQVLADSRAKNILTTFGGTRIRDDSGFVGPADHVGRDGDSRSWLQVAKAAKVKPMTLAVRDPLTDKPVLLWRVEDLAELLPATEKAKAALPKARAEDPDRAKEKPLAGPGTSAIRQEALPEITKAIGRAASRLTPTQFLRLYVLYAVGKAHSMDFLSILGVKTKPSLIDAPTCQALLAMEEAEVYDDQIEKLLGVDVKALLVSAKKRLLEQKVNAALPKGAVSSAEFIQTLKKTSGVVGATCDPCDCPPAAACEAGKKARSKPKPKPKAKVKPKPKAKPKKRGRR